jgi:hypothetical protein
VVVLGGVGDLAVVNDDGETASSLIEVPADAAGELGILVGHEELLSMVSVINSRGAGDTGENSQSCRR